MRVQLTESTWCDSGSKNEALAERHVLAARAAYRSKAGARKRVCDCLALHERAALRGPKQDGMVTMDGVMRGKQTRAVRRLVSIEQRQCGDRRLFPCVAPLLMLSCGSPVASGRWR